ncbi:beta-defensin 121 isoform X3 [Acinonyx jubatus]|uniref:Beta-defensin n=1 Tax=Acinonyx jubatus TaxID=32536 RepID=A0ABM3N9I6_ACIJB|nr:beta-defensin 121 isoform X3 [Acinonyx jubatus]XP_053056094.1 beta-defensin 121 isoform X3 [Acinonyx jubatus]
MTSESIFSPSWLPSYIANVLKARHCWKKLGRCRTTCKDSEVFYLLCNDETKCCVNPKHVPVKTRSLPPTGSLE